MEAVGASFTLTTAVWLTVAQLGVLKLKVTVFTPPLFQLTVWEPSVLAVAGLPFTPKSQL